MESIYCPEYFETTGHTKLNEYFEKYHEELIKQQKDTTENVNISDSIEIITENDINIAVEHNLNTNNSEEFVSNPVKERDSIKKLIFSFINDDSISAEQQDELDEICSPRNLYIPEEKDQLGVKDICGPTGIIRNFKPYEISDDALNLETVKSFNNKSFLQKFNENDRMTKKYDIAYESSNPEKMDLIPGKDYIVYIRFYRPFKFIYMVDDNRGDYLKYDQEIAVLGTNTLSELRDKILCVSNETVLTDISENPSNSGIVYAKSLYPSNFIFIDGVFYNDMRAPNSKDNSAVIRNWAEDKQIGNFTTALQTETKINSLTPRFASPYVYQHHGICEHVFIFSQARILNKNDNLNSKDYPLVCGLANTRTVFCYICGNATANILVIDSDRLPENKSPLCQECFKSYFYINGKKIGNFKAYPYVSRRLI